MTHRHQYESPDHTYTSQRVPHVVKEAHHTNLHLAGIRGNKTPFARLQRNASWGVQKPGLVIAVPGWFVATMTEGHLTVMLDKNTSRSRRA